MGLRIIAFGLLLLLITPFNKGAFHNWTHMTIGVITAFAGGALAATSLPDWNLAHLLQGEIVHEIGFRWCLIGWTYALSDRHQRVLASYP
jgi:hypothetical protein